MPLPLAFCPVKPSAWGLLVVGRMTSGNGDGMEYFLQQLINGVTLGSIYGLIADSGTIREHLSLVAGILPGGGIDTT